MPAFGKGPYPFLVQDDRPGVHVIDCDRPELLRGDVRRHMQMVALRTVEGVPLLVAEAREISLPIPGVLVSMPLVTW
jgi:hypothetical protein